MHSFGNKYIFQRFLPSEFGHDVDRADPVEPGLRMYKEKRQVRRLIEELGVAYTYICCNSIASWPYYDNTHPSEVVPPLDRFQIYGDGTVKGTHQACMQACMIKSLRNVLDKCDKFSFFFKVRNDFLFHFLLRFVFWTYNKN